MQLADDPLCIYASELNLNLKDIEAAMLQENDRVIDGLDEHPRQAGRATSTPHHVS